MLIQTKDQFDSALTVLLDADEIVVDTETTKTSKWDNRYIIGIATYCEIKGKEPHEVGFYFPFRHQHDQVLFKDSINLPETWLRDLAPGLTKKESVYIFHNAKFDRMMMRKENIEIQDTFFYDTLLLANLVDENQFNLKLDYLAKVIFNENKIKLDQIEKNLGGWEKIPPEVMGKYAEKDCELEFKLYQHFLSLFEGDYGDDAEKVWHREMEISKLLEDVEFTGIKIKEAKARQLANTAYQQLVQYQKELGFDPLKKKELARKLFGEKPEGLGFVPAAYSKQTSKEFPKGLPIMDKEHLLGYDHPIVSTILEYRSTAKAYATWYQGFLDAADKHYRMHPTYKLHGTVTGRFSCANPNMQQLPRDREKSPAKDILAAEEGFELWEFDYQQIEYRLAAAYANEEIIIEAYKQGVDFHQLTAEQLGIPRQDGKVTNFTVLYGGGPKKLAYLLGIPVPEALAFLRTYHQTYPKLSETADLAEQAAAQRGFVKLWTGRRRHFRHRSEVHKAFNSIIQGGAAEICKESMLRYWKLENKKSKLVGNVHDSLLFEIPVEYLNNEIQKIKEIMEWATHEFPLDFPVDAKKIY